MTDAEHRRRRVMAALVAVHDFFEANRPGSPPVRPFHVRWFGLDECKALAGVSDGTVAADLRWLARHAYARRLEGHEATYEPTTEGRAWITA